MLQMKIKMQDFPVGKCRLAYTFAKYCHSEMNQKRKGSGEPYFVHPKGVAKIVMDNGGNEDQIIAAFCHDLLEDVPFVSYEELKHTRYSFSSGPFSSFTIVHISCIKIPPFILIS